MDLIKKVAYNRKHCKKDSLVWCEDLGVCTLEVWLGSEYVALLRPFETKKYTDKISRNLITSGRVQSSFAKEFNLDTLRALQSEVVGTDRMEAIEIEVKDRDSLELFKMLYPSKPAQMIKDLKIYVMKTETKKEAAKNNENIFKKVLTGISSLLRCITSKANKLTDEQKENIM